MTRKLSVISGKGGVGKTTLVSNLAYALTELGQDVVVLDANLTTSNLGLHLGLQLAPKTLHDIIRGDVKLRDATYTHPYGFKVVPASMSVNDLIGVDVSKLPEIASNFVGKADFIILDSAPGLGREALSAMEAADEILLITNPNLPSVVDALKTLKLAERTGKKILGVVVNRVKGIKHELSREEIERILSTPVIAEIPEDKNVSRSVAIKWPLVDYCPDSPASIEIKRLACKLVGKEFEQKPKSILEKLIGLFR